MTPFQTWLTEILVQYDSDRAFARALGIEPSSVLAWKTHGYLPTIQMEEKLAEVTGVSIEEIGRLVRNSRRIQEQLRFQRLQERRAARLKRLGVKTAAFILGLAAQSPITAHAIEQVLLNPPAAKSSPGGADSTSSDRKTPHGRGPRRRKDLAKVLVGEKSA